MEQVCDAGMTRVAHDFAHNQVQAEWGAVLLSEGVTWQVSAEWSEHPNF